MPGADFAICSSLGRHVVSAATTGSTFAVYGVEFLISVCACGHVVDHVPDHNTKPVIVVAAELH